MLDLENDEKSYNEEYIFETGAVLFLLLLIMTVLIIAAWSGVLLSLGLIDTTGPLEMILDLFSFAQMVQASSI